MRLFLAGTVLVAVYLLGRYHDALKLIRQDVTSTIIRQGNNLTPISTVGLISHRNTTIIPQNGRLQLKQGHLCDGYDGILFISHVLATAGAGTLFFLSLVDSLLYAEKYNLYPFIHVNNDLNRPCYDPKVHGNGSTIVEFSHLTGRISSLIGKGNMSCWNKQETQRMRRPGPPIMEDFYTKNYTLKGNGLWNSYFEPVTPYPFDDDSCQETPVFQMKRHDIDKEMHRCSEVAVRSWLFQGTPRALLPQKNESLRDWLWGNRRRASSIVHKHYSLLPWLQELVDKANPEPRNCLAAHIRLTDKAAVVARDKKGLEVYQPYIEAYANATRDDKSPIYIATDDARVLETIQKAWDPEISARVIVQSGVTRSTSNKSTFSILKNDKHRSNSEALVEMYAMSKCSFFVHGFSGMAEAVVYLNPSLHEKSVNIDDPERQSPKEFGSMVEDAMKQH
jgi:hypothetical protein